MCGRPIIYELELAYADTCQRTLIHTTLQIWSHATRWQIQHMWRWFFSDWSAAHIDAMHTFTVTHSLQLRTPTKQSISSTKQKVRLSHNRNTSNNTTIAPWPWLSTTTLLHRNPYCRYRLFSWHHTVTDHLINYPQSTSQCYSLYPYVT